MDTNRQQAVEAPALSIIIPSLNTRALLKRMLRSLGGHDFPRHVQTIVVDVGSTDGTLEMLERDFPGVLRIVGVPNRGYGAAINAGLRYATSRDVLACNSDLIFTDSSLEGIVQILSTIDDKTLVGFRLCNPDGSLQVSAHRLPGRFAFTWMFAPSRYWPWMNSRLLGDLDEERMYGVTEVGWVTGAALAARRALFEGLGGFDERFFMNSDEVDLCRRVWDSGGRVLYTPSITLIHVGGGSAPDAERSVAWLAQGMARYTRKHFGPWTLAAARSAALLAWLSSVPVWVVKRLVGKTTSRGALREAIRYGRALGSR